MQLQLPARHFLSFQLMQVYTIQEDLYHVPDIILDGYEGLLAVGGELELDKLILYYSNGIFPWYNVGEPVQWWSPKPRLILLPEEVSVSSSMKTILRKKAYTYSCDTDFLSVMLHCKTIDRKGQKGSWIHGEIVDAFHTLHQMGLAHSVEVWEDDLLVGGLYGLAIGKMFCGESMFSKIQNASKIALIALCKMLTDKKFDFIDCQQDTPHMRSMGAHVISMEEFKARLDQNKKHPVYMESWKTARHYLDIHDLCT